VNAWKEKDLKKYAETAELHNDRPALGTIAVATEVEAPVESEGVDPCKTPFAHAIVPDSMVDEESPTSRDLLLDDRVERLLRENYELLKERKELREAANMRIKRCSELLGEARKAKRLVRLLFRASGENIGESPRNLVEWDALADWAAEPL